jgi:hypothetical protein
MRQEQRGKVPTRRALLLLAKPGGMATRCCVAMFPEQGAQNITKVWPAERAASIV